MQQKNQTAQSFNLNDPTLNRRVEKYIAWWATGTPDPRTGCIESSLKASDPRGYTLRTCPITQKQDYIHRIAYRVFVGDIPDGKVVRHQCNNPKCHNYEHLQLGSQLDNMRDKMAAGRHRTGISRRKRLTPDVITAIKRDLATGMSGYAAARKYGVSEMSISNIRTGRTYKTSCVAGFIATTRKPGRPPKKPSTSARGISLGRSG